MNYDKEACWTLLKAHYESLDLSSKKRAKAKEALQHTERVVELCEDVTNLLEPRLQSCVDRNLLEAAAILHDIAKFDNTDSHEEDAIDVIRAECAKQTISPIDPRDFASLDEVIRWHRDGFDPHPRVALEAAILRAADKLDKFSDEPQNKAEKSCEKTLNIIKDYLKDTYKSIETACWKARVKNFYP